MDKHPTSPTRTALVAGATGLVGRELLALVLADKSDGGYAAVHCLGRRKPAQGNLRLTFHAVDFAALPALPSVDDVFIALGTTIKVAGSQQAFRAIDFDAVVAVARAARTAGATRLGVVSAMGASPTSAVFYNRVKGEMEAAVSSMGYETVVIARPSFLAGDREVLGQPLRGGEKLALNLSRLLGGLIPANYRSINAAQVAASLLAGVQRNQPGTQVLLSGTMQQPRG